MTSYPLRVLAVVSRPIARDREVEIEGEKFCAISPLSWPPVQTVRDGLRRALRDKDAPVAVRYLPHVTLSDLISALTEPYDVLHFAGHGTEEGQLLLEHEDGTAHALAPDDLADALRGAEVGLALLSACHSGAAGDALQGAGIPDVVMVDEEWPMDARVAALFNGLFYAHLARGRTPSRAYEAGLRAVRLDDRCGDRAGRPVNRWTGEEEPLYSERFEGAFQADEPLAAPEGDQGYQELRPLEVPCTVPSEEIFVGREVERIRTIRLMRDTRWVTLVGPGGIGKTAAARRVARWQHERNRFPAGVLAVDAVEVESAEELATAFAAALSDPRLGTGFRPDPRHPWAAIAAALDGPYLVLLDNAEDLEDEAVRALDEQLLSQAGELHLLATARRPLGAVGREQTVEIESLPVGTGRDPGPAERGFPAYAPAGRQREVRAQLATMRTLCREMGGYPLGRSRPPTASAPSSTSGSTHRSGGAMVDTTALTSALRQLSEADLDTWARQQLPDQLHDQYGALSREEKEDLAITLAVQQARAALEAERVNVGAAIGWAAEADAHGLAQELVEAVDPFLTTAGYWRELVQYGWVRVLENPPTRFRVLENPPTITVGGISRWRFAFRRTLPQDLAERS